MEKRSSFIQQFIVVLLVVCMNLTVANGAVAMPQAGTNNPHRRRNSSTSSLRL